MENPSKECAICHIDWIESPGSFAGETSSDSVNDRGEAGSAEMCLSCHDGSVADSRFKVWMSDSHVTGRPPPDWVEIPTNKFPLDEEGKMTCATCHSAHTVGVAPDSDMETAIFLRQPNINSSLCLLCHGRFGGEDTVHHPFGKQAKAVPASLLAAGAKTSPDGYSIICQTCHEPHGSRNQKLLVLSASRLCVSCHGEKSAEISHYPTQVMHRLGRTFSGFRLPQELIDKGAQFGPGGELSCLSCHRMHGGAIKPALLVVENKQGSLCMECHEKQQTVAGSIHDMRLRAPDALHRDNLKADESGVCAGCHTPLGWAGEARSEQSENLAFCVECHREGGLAWDKSPYIEAHPVNISMPEDRQTDLPLDGDERKVTCGTCHDPHGEGDSSTLLRLPVNDLCIDCHKGKQAIFESMHDPVKGGWAKEMGLEALGLCTDCHEVHRVEKKPGIWTLLERTGETQLTCQGCHNRDGAGKPAETRHVAKAMQAVTVFPLARNDTSTSGKIMCVTCHEIHQGTKGNKLLRASRNDSRICLHCHPNSSLLFDTSHDFRSSAPDVTNVLGEKVDQSGPCETCHLIHEAEHGKGPWAFEPAGSEEYVTNLCFGCHQPGKPAERFVPRFTDHPDVPLFNRIDSDEIGYLPTFNDQGERSNKGVISCLSCHDPHLGNVNPQSDTPGAASSIGKFLRSYSRQKLCVDCHGRESIWRYLYFHKREVFPSVRYRN